MKPTVLLPICLVLAGCGDDPFGRRDPPPVIVTLPSNALNGAIPRPAERPGGDDTAAPSAPAEPDAELVFLGFSRTGPGDADLPGLWLETPLVDTEQPGRVVAENGLPLLLTLRPSGGDRASRSRLSLEGFRILGLPPTARPVLPVLVAGPAGA